MARVPYNSDMAYTVAHFKVLLLLPALYHDPDMAHEDT